METAALRLFKALPVEENGSTEFPSHSLFQEMIQRGLLFTEDILGQYSDDYLRKVMRKQALDPQEINNSFHKCWQTIATADMETLVIQQLMHYLTTYGFEALGIYDKDTVYIPAEELDIPNVDVEQIPLTIVKGMTSEQLKTRTLDLLNSGIALKSDTVNDTVMILSSVDVSSEDLAWIENKEAMCMMYNMLDIVPKDPQDFVRFLIYKLTGSPMIIKNSETIEGIKSAYSLDTNKLDPIGMYFKQYKNQYGLKKLSEIFYRFKPLFLAFKKAGGNQAKHYVNVIRKKAKQYHQPMPDNYLEEITHYIKTGQHIDPDRLEEELSKVTVFRKIRLAYALNYRINGDSDKIMYKIRNGKGFVSEFDFPAHSTTTKMVYNKVLRHITAELKQNVDGCRVYIPWYIEYALPSTEKQFAGNFPNGTCVSVPGPMVFGVHWTDLAHKRIDLDLSWSDVEGKIGWNARWRTGDIMFSGDMTSAPAPKGASEFFRIEPYSNKFGLLRMNYFNFHREFAQTEDAQAVPYDVVIGCNHWSKSGNNCMLDPNDVYVQSRTEIDDKESILGVAASGDDGVCRFWFCETKTASSAVAGMSPISESIREYMASYFSCPISLTDLLEDAGAVVLTRREEKHYWLDPENGDIDLSPENLERDTIINLFS